jgi:hypothetical protein
MKEHQPPMDSSWFMGRTLQDTVYRVHYACDLTGEDQPAFEGFFMQMAENRFMQVVGITAWRSETGACPLCGEELT